MYILGINSAYHESSAALIKDGILIAAAEEERFNRIKHGKEARVDNPHVLPIEAIEFCLSEAGIKFCDIDHIGYSFNPVKRLEQNIGVDEKFDPGGWGSKEGERLFYSLLMGIPHKLESLYNIDLSERFHWIDHHLCHVCSAYFVSPFEDAALLSIDGIGEYETVWFGKANDTRVRRLASHTYPNSVGLLWEKISKHLGFGEYGVWKVMGMHSYGNSDVYYDCFRQIVDYDDNGKLFIDNKITAFRSSESSAFEEIFGKPRSPDEPLENRHMNIAASLQKITTEILLSSARYLKTVSKSNNLCMAGGVALNCVSNGALNESGIFKNIFIQPAAHDAGTSIGAAFYIWNVLMKREERFVMEHAYWGPKFDDDSIRKTLEFNDLKYERVENIAERVAKLISDGNIVAWFQGRMEFGPRALGNRSILADPRRKELIDVINEKVKHREYFRPFAPSVLEDKYERWFKAGGDFAPTVFMLNCALVREDKRHLVPAITHVDGSSRPQIVAEKTNPLYYRMISLFESITGVPLVLNTSLNDCEPIIRCPEDAVRTCIKTKLDYLAIGEFIVEIK